jgi:organic hydroperoxide reductase OsmC/OhrA
MSEYRAAIRWTRESSDFSYDSYDRNHGWKFGSGVEVAASAAPEFRGDPERVNPEEAFVAAIAGCHMLTFLAIAARKRLVVDSYTDKATGYMEKNAAGKLAITRVVLRPADRVQRRISLRRRARPYPRTGARSLLYRQLRAHVGSGGDGGRGGGGR